MSPLAILAVMVLVAASPGACDVNIPAVPAKRYQAFMSQWISQSAAAAACQDAGGKLADLGTNCKLDAIRAAIPGTDLEGFPVLTELWIAGNTNAAIGPIPDQNADVDGPRCRILSNWLENGQQPYGQMYNVYAKNCNDQGRRYLCEF